MSNNKNNTINIYDKVERATHEEEIESLLNSSQQIIANNTMATINIENDISAGTSHQYLQTQQRLQQMNRDVDTTRIDMETNINLQSSNDAENPNADERHRIPNLFDRLREARHQFNRSQTLTWRENLYEALYSPTSPRVHTNVLRAIFPPSSNGRYEAFRTNALHQDDQFHFLLNNPHINLGEGELHSLTGHGLGNQSSTLIPSRQSSRSTDERSFNENTPSESNGTAVNISIESNINSRRLSNSGNSPTNVSRHPQRQASTDGGTPAPTNNVADGADADANAMGEIIVKLVTHILYYIPFIFIVIVKFMHDHLLGILDILLLQSVVIQLNNSIKEQVAKLNQKSYAALFRDLFLVSCVIIYRLILSPTAPDPFGLLINHPGPTITINLSKHNTYSKEGVLWSVPENSLGNEVPSAAPTNSLTNEIYIRRTFTLGTLLYYVAVNDLVLKLITQLFKIIVTMFPSKVIRHKSRARLYALMENTSQFYRALVPIRQCFRFFFEFYTGYEVISGIFFSTFYVAAKLFELFARYTPLKKSFLTFMLNVDHDRKPTQHELEAAGTACPICHDAYLSPVILKCGHIFCDECVNTWFKREQTCPMCRAKVCEDPSWQHGATTNFYQLF